MTKLTAIKGVGPATAAKLEEQGYDSVESLPKTVEELTELDFNDAEIDQILEIQAASAEGGDAATDGGEDSDTEGELTGELGNADPEANESASAPSAPDESPQESETPAEDASDKRKISFKILSGPHKNRTLTWVDGNPAARFLDGAFASLTTLAVNELEEDEEAGTVDFVLVWGPTKGRAQLSREDFDYFAQEVRKKPQTQLFQA